MVPDGSEKGVYLAIDLGGTNFRVCSVQLHGDSTYSITQTKTSIPPELMLAPTCKQLFHFLALRVREFLVANHPDDIEQYSLERIQHGTMTDSYRRHSYRRLGFTFSFAYQQLALNRGTLLKWTKGFDIADAVGQDPCALLQTELDELQVPVLVTALVNDTVGTLMARSYTSPGKSTTLIGAVFGTGTNGAYVEKLSKVKKLHTSPDFSHFDDDDLMIINTEWGGFDDELSILPTTEFDIALDMDSVNPGSQHFEKRISGMYLGEVVRRALLSLVSTGRLTEPIADSLMQRRWGIDSSFLSIIAADNSKDLSVANAEVQRVFGVADVNIDQVHVVKLISEAVARRAIRLAAVAVAAVVIQSGRLMSNPTSHLGSRTKLFFSYFSEYLPQAVHRTISQISTLVNKSFVWLFLPFYPSLRTSCGTIKSLDCTGKMAARELSKVPSQPVIADETSVIDVGVDGSLVEHYPDFQKIMRHALREIKEIGEAGEQRIRIGMARDGSGIGAALVARAAEQQRVV